MEMIKRISYLKHYQQEGVEVTSNKKKTLQRLKMNDRVKRTEMTKKLPQGHNIGGGNRQKRRQAYKLEKKNSE